MFECTVLVDVIIACSPSSVLVGASSDPSINADDPVSDEFFFLVWNAAAKLNATIYDKV